MKTEKNQKDENLNKMKHKMENSKYIFLDMQKTKEGKKLHKQTKTQADKTEGASPAPLNSFCSFLCIGFLTAIGGKKA